MTSINLISRFNVEGLQCLYGSCVVLTVLDVLINSWGQVVCEDAKSVEALLVEDNEKVLKYLFPMEPFLRSPTRVWVSIQPFRAKYFIHSSNTSSWINCSESREILNKVLFS